MSYGILPAGFSRKPLAVILAEIETQLITELGPEVIQTSQSPLGQINGLFADMISELWDVAEDVYQSYDPLQAESTRLDILGNIRLIKRGASENDASYRQAITNDDTARITYADFIRSLKTIPGVTYARIFTNETGQNNEFGMPANTVSAVVIGGEDLAVADVVNDYVAPGVSMYGNTVANLAIDGYCRALKFVRPLEIETTLQVTIKLDATARGCPAPSPNAVATALLEYLNAEETRPWNGQPLDAYVVRQFIESTFPGTRFFSMVAVRADRPEQPGGSIDFAFFEIAKVVSVEVEGF